MGIRDKPIAPASLWQNGFAERLIGSIRRECLDHAIICGETHLRRVVKSYADYYNRFRTHRSLNKDVPGSRSVQRTGVIRSRAIPQVPDLSSRYTQPARSRIPLSEKAVSEDRSGPHRKARIMRRNSWVTNDSAEGLTRRCAEGLKSDCALGWVHPDKNR